MMVIYKDLIIYIIYLFIKIQASRQDNSLGQKKVGKLSAWRFKVPFHLTQFKQVWNPLYSFPLLHCFSDHKTKSKIPSFWFIYFVGLYCSSSDRSTNNHFIRLRSRSIITKNKLSVPCKKGKYVNFQLSGIRFMLYILLCRIKNVQFFFKLMFRLAALLHSCSLFAKSWKFQ